MNANDIRLAFAAWKLLNRKHHLSTARFERLTKEPLTRVVGLVEKTFDVKVQKLEGGVYHIGNPAKGKRTVVSNVRKPRKNEPGGTHDESRNLHTL